MRGGTNYGEIRQDSSLGLSPRARGNPALDHREAGEAGTIPACAGEPKSWLSIRPASRDYPRVRGGTPENKIDGPIAMGLSPRARGNLPGQRARCARDGTIPACAGEPTTHPVDTKTRRDYPRVRGGTCDWKARLPRNWGLSPRARGNHPHSISIRSQSGTIPACAGEPRISA